MNAVKAPAEHYRDAERLLAAAESPGTEGVQAALAAIGHALLAQAPRRARRAPTPPPDGMSPGKRWLLGDDYPGGES